MEKGVTFSSCDGKMWYSLEEKKKGEKITSYSCHDFPVVNLSSFSEKYEV